MQWQYCPDNTGAAKRRRAKKAAAEAAATAAAPNEPASEANTPVLHTATDLTAHSQALNMNQCEVQCASSLSGHVPAAEPAGASLSVSDAGKGPTNDTGPNESSAVQPVSKDKASGNDPRQLPSQVAPQVLSQPPLWPLSPLPTAQPAASTLIEAAHVLDHMGTCDHAEEVSPIHNPGALQVPAQLQSTQQGDFSHRARQLAVQEPTETSSDLPKDSSLAQENIATPDQPMSPKLQTLTSFPHPSSNAPTQDVQLGAENVAKRAPAESGSTFDEQGPCENTNQATAAPTAAQVTAPLFEAQAHNERAVREWSPEPRAASKGPQAAMGPEHVAHALHNAFASYANSRSRSHDSQQQQRQPRQLSVPNPFRVSPEVLQRPNLPSAQLPSTTQDSLQTPAQNCLARATPRSVSPEALHVLQLGIADQQLCTMQNSRRSKSAAHSKSPEAQLLADCMPCKDALPELAAATSPMVDPKNSNSWAEPDPFICEAG